MRWYPRHMRTLCNFRESNLKIGTAVGKFPVLEPTLLRMTCPPPAVEILSSFSAHGTGRLRGWCRMEKLWREEVCSVGLENASMCRVIGRFMKTRTVVAGLVISLSVALTIFSVVSLLLIIAPLRYCQWVSADLYSAITWNGDTSKALVSLMSDGKEMRFQFPLYSVQTQRADHATNQAVSSKPSDQRLRKPAGVKCAETKARNIQFATTGRTDMMAAGNFGDWHAAVGGIPWSSVPKTPMNSHGKLVLHPLWNRQPVQIITQQPWKTTLVFLVSGDQTRCRILNPLQLVCHLLPRRHQDRVAIIDWWSNEVNTPALRGMGGTTEEMGFLKTVSDGAYATVRAQSVPQSGIDDRKSSIADGWKAGGSDKRWWNGSETPTGLDIRTTDVTKLYNIWGDRDVILSVIVTAAMLEPWRYTMLQQYNVFVMRQSLYAVCA